MNPTCAQFGGKIDKQGPVFGETVNQRYKDGRAWARPRAGACFTQGYTENKADSNARKRLREEGMDFRRKLQEFSPDALSAR
jgi:hypothetical protein